MSLDGLIHAAQSGDPRAEQRLFRAIRLELMSYFRRRVPEADVEDLVQRTLEVIARELPGFEHRGPGSFRSFVFSVAHNRARTHWRQRRPRGPEAEAARDLIATPEPIPTPAEVTLEQEERTLLRTAMRSLRTTFRRAIEGRLRDDSPGTVAAAESIKLSSLRNRVRRALAALRIEVDARRRTRQGREQSPMPT